MSNEFENLAQTAANVLVSAIAADSWKAAKHAFSAIVGHERQIDDTRTVLATRSGPDLAGAQAELAQRWVTRLRDFLDENPGAAADLRAVVARFGVASGPAITTVSQHTDRKSAAGSVGGDVRGNTGDVYIGVRKVDKRRFRFSPLLFFGHAAKAHPFVASAVTFVTIGGVAGGLAVAHGNGPHAGSSPPAVSSSGPVLTHARTGAGWAQLGLGADRTSDQPDETRIGTGNVARLSQARTYHTGAGVSAPLIANGILYVDTAKLYAFDATGAAGCSAAPVTCTPLWTAPTAYFAGMAVADGKVFVTDGEGVQAFSAAGSVNCSGTPKICNPLWTASMPGDGATSSAPAVAGGVVYVGTFYEGLYAFDAAGSVNCSAGATAKKCAPLWTAPAPATIEATPAVADGVVYVAGGNGALTAFAAGGSGNCPGTGTKTCTRAPLWTSAAGPLVSASSPAVANGVVYVSSTNGGAYAYDAAGSLRCSTGATAKTCSPLWSALASGFSGEGSPPVVGGILFVNVPGDGRVYAYSL